MESFQFEKEYRVHVYETGPNGKLNLYSLFNYLQDIASDHAEILGFGRNDLLSENRFWVLSRMYGEIKNWPVWEDSIIIKTWPNGTDNLFAIRNYEVSFPDGRSIASISSSWLILDMTTRKIQRPTTLAHFSADIKHDVSPVRSATKLSAAHMDGTTAQTFRIKTSDLDLNLHTNNVKYLNWVYDTYDLGFLMKNDPQSTEINYLAESKYGEEIMIRTSVENDVFYNHSIFRTVDNKELCRIKIEWKKDSSVE